MEPAADRAPPKRSGLVAVAALAAVYFVAARLGLTLAFVNPSATAVWPPTGIALAAFLRLGYGVWPGVFLGAFLANVTTTGSVAASIGISIGNTLEGVAGAYLINRFAGGPRPFEHARDVFKLALLAGLLSTMISATLGVISLVAGGLARWADSGSIWLTWWLGDVGGVLVVAPALLLWTEGPRERWGRAQAVEAAGLLLCLALVGMTIFGGLAPPAIRNYPLDFLGLPFLLWAAFRFGRREVATGLVMLAGIAIWGTLHGYGPFAREMRNESLLLLQAFMGVTAVMSLALAAVVAEQRQAEDRQRKLAVSDPLTGLANYRQLMEVLETEIGRSARTDRPFAVVFLDVDDLKKINDRDGHLVGSQALCRVADVLRVSCRAIDTAARFGGDEFALVLPETGEEMASQVAQRIVALLAEDRNQPQISVSVGVAVYPRDGRTVEALLDVADVGLYQVKKRVDHHRAGAGEAGR